MANTDDNNGSTAGSGINIDDKDPMGQRIKHLRFVYAKFLSGGELMVDWLELDMPDNKEFETEAYRAYVILRFRNTWIGRFVRKVTSFISFILPASIIESAWLTPPSQFDMCFRQPTRIVFCIDSKHAQIAGKEGFRFVPSKKQPAGTNPLISEPHNDTFNHREMFKIGRKQRWAVTVVNLYWAPPTRNQPHRIYAFELDVDAKHTSIGTPPIGYSTRVIIDPGVGNDGA